MSARNVPTLSLFAAALALWLFCAYRHVSWVAWPIALLLAWQFGAFDK